MDHGRRASTRRRDRLALGLGVALLSACSPELTAGEWVCGESGAEPTSVKQTDPLVLPWSTSFEDRFCDYAPPQGFCYQAGNASYELVTTPVHSGRYAAAFRVSTEGGTTRQQARCVRQGTLPTSAYYGAWYYVPNRAETDGKVWNLIHFQGGNDEKEILHNILDISLVNVDDGELELVVYSPVARKTWHPEERTPIPIGAWFHIELFFTRAADESGELALYQDGVRLLSATDEITDDTLFGQWYVGNYSDGITPATSIVYVDDVSIRAR